MRVRSFRCLVVSQAPDGSFVRKIVTRNADELPPGDLLVRVLYSSLNYKDALAASGRRGVARGYPLTPGVDAAGVIEHSSVPGFVPGDPVIVCGHELGTGAPGGFGQYIRVPAEWAIRLPPGLSSREAMAIGTAGFTAAYSLRTLEEQGLQPGQGDLLVTGASGGVGSMAVAICSRLGYAVTASSGKPKEAGFLSSLGARAVISREEAAGDPGKSLLKERWTAVIDSVGGSVLAGAIKAARYGGLVAACGNAQSAELPLTVFPFILRGVRLLGIESAQCSAGARQELWEKLAGDWKPPMLGAMTRECGLEGLEHEITTMLAGGIRGRVIVRLEND